MFEIFRASIASSFFENALNGARAAADMGGGKALPSPPGSGGVLHAHPNVNTPVVPILLPPDDTTAVDALLGASLAPTSAKADVEASADAGGCWLPKKNVKEGVAAAASSGARAPIFPIPIGRRALIRCSLVNQASAT